MKTPSNQKGIITLKKWAKDLNREFIKEKIWPINICKYPQLHWNQGNENFNYSEILYNEIHFSHLPGWVKWNSLKIPVLGENMVQQKLLKPAGGVDAFTSENGLALSRKVKGTHNPWLIFYCQADALECP